MSSPHFLAISQEAVCVAEDFSVAFYAPKTLKKFRVERFSGRRLAGLWIARSADGLSYLHVIDAEANWFLFSLKTMELVASSSIELGGQCATSKSRKGMVSTRQTTTSVEEELRSQGILEAHFHEADGQLHCVLLTSLGVYEAPVHNTGAVRAVRIISFPPSMCNTFMSVGRLTGLVVVAQLGEKWSEYSIFKERDANHQRRFLLPIAAQSLAVSPTSDSLAVGGTRGELIVYPSINEQNFFSDHWHHTPLTAISFSLDGNSLYTGAMESIVLVWSMSSFTFKKIGCSLGPVKCILPSRIDGSLLLLTCAESTLAFLDLLQMRVRQFIEGVQWSTDEACSGLVVSKWMGQPAVILTGLPNVVRICDPFTQQTVYSLHISSQMETVPSPPRHGIQHVGLLNGNNTIVTYEEFTGTSLPSMLRFWAYNANARRHTEVQSICPPHRSRIVALQVDSARSRVFTLSIESMKCWVEVEVDVNDAYATGQKSWVNKSSSATPSRLVGDMLLSSDVSLCFVSDDNVHVYNITDVHPGQPWKRVLTLTQNASLATLKNLQLLTGPRVVVAQDWERVYFWSLASPRQHAVVWDSKLEASSSITAICTFSSTSILAATDDGNLWELQADGTEMGRVLGHAAAASGQRLLHMKPMPHAEQQDRVAVVDNVSGFRLLHVSLQKTEKVREVEFVQADSTTDVNGADARGSEEGRKLLLTDYFHDIRTEAHDPTSSKGVAAMEMDDAVLLMQSQRWLGEVLADSAYTAPPMSVILSSYLKKRAGLLVS
ncbi:hypothetical protein TRVL_03464 [Trypanosoma vivax]|uniref:Uncharacterized protein n=1 Tax=Trypanosoma vivax (strain Y486) TaxID=1055687 RepID=G0UC73_TRYVY|nr:hypothetical protein TRVL_03464 [Trypanosoma vivax]CCC53421.1 conserved hypothetical protein [Trypanosoma vivax Y486]